MLELKNITKIYELGKPKDKNYQTVDALKGINITFRKSEFVSILGPSGCGKTTLLNIIGGLDHYNDGDLIINNISTKKYTDRDWDNYRNHKIGFVFQSYNLIPHQTILENVELALTLSGVSKKERKEKAKEALIKVGLKDKINAKPSQLSGGQMQRVAIARAIVNNPDIILADEPTGALDTQTSYQIMDLLKEISKEKLIIMVTHNPDIAETYSTRIIKLLDGIVIDDSKPFLDNEKENELELEKNRVKEKTSMSFLTALSLSGKNLLTKKKRTALVAFAGSIGIIGISLILSLSSGFQNYINEVQKDTLSTYPLTVKKDVVDISSVIEAMMDKGEDSYVVEEDGSVHANAQMVEMFNGIIKKSTTNNLSNFKQYIDENDDLFKDYTINYTYNIDLNIYNENYKSLNPSTVFTDLLSEILYESGNSESASIYMQSASMLNTDIFAEMLNNRTLLENQYDLVGEQSRWPTRYDECILVINEDYTINDYYLYALGLTDTPTLKEIAQGIINEENYNIKIDPIKYDELIGKSFKILLNTDFYEKQEDDTYVDKKDDAIFISKQIDNENVGIDLKIVGIVKPNSDAVAHSIQAPIGYDSSLTTEIINQINKSDIVIKQQANKNIDILTGQEFPNQNMTTDEKKNKMKEDINNMSTEELKLVLQKDASVWKNFESLPDTQLKPIVINMIESIDDETQINSLYSFFYGENTYINNITNFGVTSLSNPETISFYCKDFESKDKLKEEINKYNNLVKNDTSLGETYVISYSDYVALMMSSITIIIDAISYVLISFVGVSLVVSSIMIGIITYISVFERTKEIGVLRSIGASKKNIKNVFTAESLIIGLISGVLGICVTLLLNIPINIIINSLTGIGTVSKLPVGGAIILILLSCLLTFIAGLIPAKVASQKDPVVALRTE